MKISHDAKKKNVKGQSSYLTMNNLEKHKRRDVFFFKHSQKFGKIGQMIPPNKTSTGEFQLKMIPSNRKAKKKRKNGRCFV